MCANGCECTSTGTSSTCASPSSLGTLQVGQGTTYTGNLVPAGQEAYLSVTFNGNTNVSYHPHITMTAGAAEFVFDILTNCAADVDRLRQSRAATPTGRTDWEEVYTGGDPNEPGNFNAIPAVGADGTVIIHVYRRPGMPGDLQRLHAHHLRLITPPPPWPLANLPRQPHGQHHPDHIRREVVQARRPPRREPLRPLLDRRHEQHAAARPRPPSR